MDNIEKYTRAEEIASLIAPSPKHEPYQYAFIAFAAIFFPGALVLAVYGIDVDRHPWPLLTLTIVVTALTYIYTWDQRRRHDKVLAEELKRLSDKTG